MPKHSSRWVIYDPVEVDERSMCTVYNTKRIAFGHPENAVLFTSAVAAAQACTDIRERDCRMSARDIMIPWPEDRRRG